MKDKICVITGGTSGIGRSTALALGACGATVILLGRNARAGQAVVEQLERIQNAPTAEYIQVDLSNQTEVRRAAERILSAQAVVDVLINNAGARYDRFRQSVDGVELTFAGNHLGHFLLTRLLLERLLASPAARIITVSSGSQSSAPPDGHWALTAQQYDRRRAYALSKLANSVFAFDLAARLSGTSATSNAYDPGGVASNFARNNGLISWARHLLAHGLRRDLIPPHRAAEGLVRLAGLPPAQAVNGRYFRRSEQIRIPAAEDVFLRRGLWDLSLRLTGVGDDIVSRAAKFFLSSSPNINPS